VRSPRSARTRSATGSSGRSTSSTCAGFPSSIRSSSPPASRSPSSAAQARGSSPARRTGFARSAAGRRAAAIGGVVLAGLAWGGHELSGAWLTFGPGYIAADWLLARDHAIPLLVGAFAIRASGNLVSVYGGGGGGVFTSLACNGAFLGQIVAELVDRSETRMLPLLGAACFLGSGYRLPIACMLLVAEQGADLLMTAVGLVAVALGQVMMGEESVSEAQVDERGAGAVGERASGS
jgi:CIC family chloride channel protein